MQRKLLAKLRTASSMALQRFSNAGQSPGPARTEASMQREGEQKQCAVCRSTSIAAEGQTQRARTCRLCIGCSRATDDTHTTCIPTHLHPPPPPPTYPTLTKYDGIQLR